MGAVIDDRKQENNLARPFKAHNSDAHHRINTALPILESNLYVFWS